MSSKKKIEKLIEEGARYWKCLYDELGVAMVIASTWPKALKDVKVIKIPDLLLYYNNKCFPRYEKAVMELCNANALYKTILPKMQLIFNNRDKNKKTWEGAIQFIGGRMRYEKNHSETVKFIYELDKEIEERIKNISDNPLVINWINTLPGFPSDFRQGAAANLLNNHFKYPIHPKRWKSHELGFRADCSGKSIEELMGLTTLGSIFVSPLEKPTGRKKQLKDFSARELEKDPKILKRTIKRLCFKDIAPPKDYVHGELELVEEAINIWFDQELGMNLISRLESHKLTPREDEIIKARLSGTEPSGTPESIRQTINRLKRKIEKKIKF